MWEKGGCEEEEEEGMGWLPSLAWEGGEREEEVHKRKKEKCIRGGRKLSTFGLVANVLGLLFRAHSFAGNSRDFCYSSEGGGIFSLQNVMFGIQRERSCWSK